jgi:hypothetical protein
LIPIPISAPQTFALLAITAAIFLLALFLPAILELKRPKDAGPRRIFEADGKEIVGFNLLLAVYFRKNSRGVRLFLEDIEPQEFEVPEKGFLSLLLPDIEF